LPALLRALTARAANPDIRRARLVSTYFDTPRHDLLHQGLVLRVRRKGRRYIQTVKSDRVAGGGLARGEWEDVVAGADPDPQARESGPLLPANIAGRLAPLFRTEISRRKIDLFPVAGTHIEVAVDRGHIRVAAGEAEEPVSEIELELKSGDTIALYDMALDLLAVAPLRLESRSKAERGYRLATPDASPLQAAHAAPVELDPGLTGDETLRRIGLACLDQVLHNDAPVLAGLPDGIHQMRVAVRRLRAILSAFSRLLPRDQRRWASGELRWLADALGAARNLDVFAADTLAPAAKALRANGTPGVPERGVTGGIAALNAAAERRRQGAYATATSALRSVRYTAILLRLMRWFDACGWRDSGASSALTQPIGDIAAGVLDRRRRASKRRSRDFAGQSPPQRHRLRIALKKLRYSTEMLAGLYQPDAVSRFTKQVKRLQDDLGEANDVAVARDIVAELASPGSSGALAGATIIEWHEHRLAAHEPRLHQHLNELLAAAPFWHPPEEEVRPSQTET
jgi:inorganic triphosphatase YgiF